MKRFSLFISTLILMSFLGIVIYAKCDTTTTYKGMTCTNTNKDNEPEGSGAYCNYDCPDGTFISEKFKPKDGDGGPAPVVPPEA